MRIAIVGIGGVGGYFGGRLANAGEETTFIARGDHLATIRDQGLRVDSILGDFVVNPARATADPSTIGIVDFVLICVKAWQVPDVAEQIKPIVGRNTTVVSLCNGVEAASQLAASLGESCVVGGLCKIISYKVGPGHIRHAGVNPEITIGEIGGSESDRVKRLRERLTNAGIKVVVPPDIDVAIWDKFLFIASLSGVGAVTRANVGVLRSLPESRRMLEGAMHEIHTVARARNVALPEDTVERTMAFVDSLPADGTASMQRDIMNGHRSELDAQTGAVVRLGVDIGVSTPVNQFIYGALLPQELQAHGSLSERTAIH